MGVLANKGRKAKASPVGERAVQGPGAQSTGLPRGPGARSPPEPFPAPVISLRSSSLPLHAAVPAPASSVVSSRIRFLWPRPQLVTDVLAQASTHSFPFTSEDRESKTGLQGCVPSAGSGERPLSCLFWRRLCSSAHGPSPITPTSASVLSSPVSSSDPLALPLTKGLDCIGVHPDLPEPPSKILSLIASADSLLPVGEHITGSGDWD